MQTIKVMSEKNTSAEQKIRAVAKQIFMRNGFEGCSSRDIAKEADVNVAMVNYYFKSKSELFKAIFMDTTADLMETMIDVFNRPVALKSKFRLFIEKEYEFLNKCPEIPLFIISELSRSKDETLGMDSVFNQIQSLPFYSDCLKAQESGEMRKIEMPSLMMLLLSNCHYPVLSRPLMKVMKGMSDEQFTEQIILHKQYVIEMLIDYLFPDNKR